MTSYKELLAQRDALEKAISEARQQELAGAISQVRAIVAEFDLTAQDVFPARKTRAPSGKVAPKFRDPSTGQTWTGRGKSPTWLVGKNRDDFLIPA